MYPCIPTDVTSLVIDRDRDLEVISNKQPNLYPEQITLQVYIGELRRSQSVPTTIHLPYYSLSLCFFFPS